jgi:hypothetical protein
MTVRLKILMLAFLSLAPSIAQAGVHRRSVGPVILDLGSLPPAPLPPGSPQPSVGRDDSQPSPQPEEPPEASKRLQEPIVLTAVFPAHAQPLGALVLTANAQIEGGERSQPSILSTLSATMAPVLIASYHPTLAEDYALFNPPAETLPTPTGSTAGPAAENRAEAQAAPPLSRLRAMVIWIGRLLFLFGVGALILTYRRRRARADDLDSPTAPLGAGTQPESAPDFDRSTAPWLRGQGMVSGADSLSLMRGKPMAIDTPASESKVFGLIEPGGAQPATTRGESSSGQGRQGRRSPS